MTEATVTETMTDYEAEIVARYESEIGAIPDCFESLDHVPADEDELAGHRAMLDALPDMLTDWWIALDSVDGDGFEYCGKSTTLPFATYYQRELQRWFDARLDLLFAMAADRGPRRVPRPDHHGGETESSNRPLGFYGQFQHVTGLGL